MLDFCQAFQPPLHTRCCSGRAGLCESSAWGFLLAVDPCYPSNPGLFTQAVPAPGVDTQPLTADEMLMESQLVAMGLLDPRQTAAGENDHQHMPPSSVEDDQLPVTKALKAEVQRVVQTLISFIERAHGLRIQVRGSLRNRS